MIHKFGFLKTGTVLSSICLGSVSFAFGFISVTSSMKASKQQEDFALAPPKSPEDLALEEQAKRFSAFYRGTELSSPESSAQPQPDHDEYKKNLADQQKQKQLHDSSPVSSVSFRLTPRLKPLPDRGWQLTSLLTPQNRLPVLERDRKSLGLEQTFTTDHFAYAASQTKERRCLAEAIYYEARSESTTGQMAVAEVVLNRVRHRAYPMTICDVVYQGSWKGKGCQFSFSCDGSKKRHSLSGAAWKRAQALALHSLLKKTGKITNKATHYHTIAVKPNWSQHLTRTRKIGDHIFYRLPEKKTYGRDA